MNLMQDFDNLNNGLKLYVWPETDGSDNSCSGSEPAGRETDQLAWERRFWQHTVVCVHCWQNFKHGLRYSQSAMRIDSAGEGNDSEEDFSPYLFNT